MSDLILFHWATYLFLFSLLVIAVGNFWPRHRPVSPSNRRSYSSRR